MAIVIKITLEKAPAVSFWKMLTETSSNNYDSIPNTSAFAISVAANTSIHLYISYVAN